MNHTPLPALMDVRDLLEGMFGRDVEAAAGAEALTPATEGGVVVGIYVTEALKSEALVAFDLALAARAGAALALLPPGQAEGAVEDRILPEALLENTAEVLNVMASLFNVPNAPHLRLYGVYDSTQALLPGDVATWLRSYGPRLDAAVSIKGYGDGVLSVITR